VNALDAVGISAHAEEVIGADLRGLNVPGDLDGGDLDAVHVGHIPHIPLDPVLAGGGKTETQRDPSSSKRKSE
jgi:hypothetical protein